MVLVHITKKSSNRKIGNIPCSITEESSCSPTCPFINSGCYAKTGPVSWHWKKVSNGTQSNTTDWAGLCSFIKDLPDNQMMRINVAGDLKHFNGNIDTFALNQLVKANKNKKAWTYTHHKMNRDNFEAVKHANKNGFTINLSANNPEHADKLAKHGVPVAVVVGDKPIKKTPQGRPVAMCPYQKTKDSVDIITCDRCRLCQNNKRRSIVGFLTE